MLVYSLEVVSKWVVSIVRYGILVWNKAEFVVDSNYNSRSYAVMTLQIKCILICAASAVAILEELVCYQKGIFRSLAVLARSMTRSATLARLLVIFTRLARMLVL